MSIFGLRFSAGFLLSAFLASASLIQGAAAEDLPSKIQEVLDATKPPSPDAKAKLAELVAAASCAQAAPKDQASCYEKNVEESLRQLLATGKTDDDKKKLQDDLLKKLLQSDALVQSQFRTALQTAADKPDNKPAVVHIVAALYGHLDDIAYEMKSFQSRSFTELGDRSVLSDRFCLATRAVRSLCQGKKSCFGTAFTGASLCGFEPAPYAENRYKALLVRYRCSTDKPDPDGVNKQDDVIPGQYVSDSSLGPNILRWALLRPSESASIICTPTDPTSSTSGKTASE